jgi:hypothetical protein
MGKKLIVKFHSGAISLMSQLSFDGHLTSHGIVAFTSMHVALASQGNTHWQNVHG